MAGFSDEEVMSYVRLLYLSSGGRLSAELMALYQDYPRNVLLILPNNLKLATVDSLYEVLVSKYGDRDTVSRASRVIAKALIDYFPTTDINGCKSVAFMGDNNRVRVLAMQCGGNYILN